MASVSRFRTMLNQVSKSLKKEELEQMKFMCADKIPKRKLEEIETPQALWEQLMEKELIGPLKPELIGHLLVQIERQDLVNDWEYMRRNGIDGHSYQDLSDEMNYVSRNIGRDWRQLARILKLHDPDIEQIEEAHPRNLREQSYASLQMWQSMVKELATRDALVKALRRCQNNLLADNIEDGAIY